MPDVFPFLAVTYSPSSLKPTDLSAVVAPPYDVLDAAGKAALLAKSDHNVVAIDLPHIPPKDAGPPAVYQAAADLFRAWQSDRTLTRLSKPSLVAYRQTFIYNGVNRQRSGMWATIETLPFGTRPGGGVLPHEQTFSGPKEDRLALMKASHAQFSPIFGLYPDDNGSGSAIVRRISSQRQPDFIARTDDAVLHEAWIVDDDPTILAFTEALRGQDVFIADGHHRYNTALTYLQLAQAAHSSPLAPDHPARRCMVVLVSMSDPGLVIGPTHRVLGGMASYSFDAFTQAAAGKLTITPLDTPLADIERAIADHAAQHTNVLGLYDFASARCFIASPAEPDPLAARFADKPPAWRALDVAVIQHLIVEDICQPALNNSNPVKWAFPHSIHEIEEIGRGEEKGSGGGKAFTPQLAVIVRPTPLDSVREVSAANVLMPQKSTFFYPKLATGLCLNPLE